MPSVSLLEAHCDAEKTKHPLKLLSKNMHCNEQPFKSLNFAEYTGHLILVSEFFLIIIIFFMTPCFWYVGTTILEECTFSIFRIFLRLYGIGVSGFSLVGLMIKNAFVWAVLIFVDNIVEI